MSWVHIIEYSTYIWLIYKESFVHLLSQYKKKKKKIIRKRFVNTNKRNPFVIQIEWNTIIYIWKQQQNIKKYNRKWFAVIASILIRIAADSCFDFYVDIRSWEINHSNRNLAALKSFATLFFRKKFNSKYHKRILTSKRLNEPCVIVTWSLVSLNWKISKCYLYSDRCETV